MTHLVTRTDAEWRAGRRYVPTSSNTRWVFDWTEFRAAGGIANFNEDQTEVTLTLPPGVKFSIGFNRSCPPIKEA